MQQKIWFKNKSNSCLKKVNSKEMKYLTIIVLCFTVIAACNMKNVQQKKENQCDLNHIRSIQNGLVSFYEVSQSESKLVTKPVEEVKQLFVLCKSDSIFPREIGQLTNLKTLTLGGGDFKEIPREIGNLKELETLILLNTSLQELPLTLYKIPQLQQISIMYNMSPFEFGEELCDNDINLEVIHTSTTLKQLPECLENSNKFKLINKEAY